MHILQGTQPEIVLTDFPYKKITKATLLKDGSPVKFSFKKKVLTLPAIAPTAEDPDQVIVLEVK
ncbi:hypothetical protein SDC9_154942 [bioreactor metagenome]|uniref:Uncharacterized protein n=1 Tax=bioreactor metagenome TaxID=1076179 RepID=A0A645F062_9ZZZZ